MATNFNTGPYFDDFDATNNFYKVLFKPGYAVQARELNQLQSILQHQVSALGNHVFQKNSIVIPGGIAFLSSADIVTISAASATSLLTFVGKTLTNAPTNTVDYTDDTTLDGYITAIVVAARDASSSGSGALYVKYFKTQTDRSKFAKGETLTVVDETIQTIVVDDTIGSTVGKVATISKGVFYTKEVFVDVAQQSVIIETDNTTTNCIIGLNIIESIVTSDTDTSLLDNAAGFPNQYAPGADRYKISLELARVDPNTTVNDDNFITMMKIENNTITYLNSSSQYAEIMSMLARRTYDANGNFIVNGLDTSVVQASDDNYIWSNVTAGKCYLGGYEYTQLINTPIAIQKPRDSNHQRLINPTSKYVGGMTYFYVAGGTYLKEIPVADSLVRFINAAPGASGAQVIGYGVFKNIQYEFGSIGTTDVYKAFFEYVSMDAGYTVENIGGFLATTATAQGAPILTQAKLDVLTGNFVVGHTIVSTTIPAQTSTLYNFVNNYAYLIKSTINDVPNTASVKDSTNGYTAQLRSLFISNYDQSITPLVEVDGDIIKTLYNDSAVNTTAYSIIQRDVFSGLVTGQTYYSGILGANDTFDNYSSANYYAFIATTGSESFVDLTSIFAIETGGKRYSFTATSAMNGKEVWIYSTINRTNISEAKKIAMSTTVTIPNPSASWMALMNQDVLSITKIVDGNTLTTTTAAWASNVATITVPTTTPHGLHVGDRVVISGIVSSNNTGGAYNSGYNGIFYVATTPNATQFTVSLTVNPGTYTSGGKVSLPPNINSDVDITSRYNVDSGNNAYWSGVGSIKLKKNATPPQGQITIQYTYYDIGAGSYISVDSYGDYSGDLSYIGQIANTFDLQNNVVEMRRYIDYRTRPSYYFFKNLADVVSGSTTVTLRDLNLSAQSTVLVGKYLIGPGFANGVAITAVVYDATSGNTKLTVATASSVTSSGIFYIGLNTTALSLMDTSTGGAKSFVYPKDNTQIRMQYVKFLPKQVMLFINRTSNLLKLDFTEIQSYSDFSSLQRDEFRLPLAYLYMAPYSVTVQDVQIEKFENPVYKMLDIHNLKKRLIWDENNMMVNQSKINQILVSSANEFGINIGDMDFWNENFMNALNQDYNSDDFSCTVYDKTYVAPGTTTRTLNLQLDSTLNSATWQQTGTALTLPFTETRAFGQSFASTFNNLNPFNAIRWNGKLILNPSVDNWIDTTSDLSATVNNTTVGANTVNLSTTSNTTTTSNAAATTGGVTVTVNIPTSTSVSQPASILPAPSVIEIVTEINNLKAAWGPDSAGGTHGITFDWKTNTGRTGRVNTDMHLSPIISKYGYDGTYARSLINKEYNSSGVKEYLNAGTNFDQKPPTQW